MSIKLSSAQGVGVQDGARLRLIRGPAEDVAAEGDREDGEIGMSESSCQTLPVAAAAAPSRPRRCPDSRSSCSQPGQG